MSASVGSAIRQRLQVIMRVRWSRSARQALVNRSWILAYVVVSRPA